MTFSHFTEDSFFSTLSKFGIGPDFDLYIAVFNAYSDSTRHYHNRVHVSECLGAFKLVSGIAEHPEEVELAIWFHDYIYDSKRSDNELVSALFIQDYLYRKGVCVDAISRVYEMIICTSDHKHCVSNRDSMLMNDVDFLILAASKSRFAEYNLAIRKECSWVCTFVYNKARLRKLRDFESRKRLFNTERFHLSHESDAMTNIRSAILELENSSLQESRSIAYLG